MTVTEPTTEAIDETTAAPDHATAADTDDPAVVEDVLVEEISIDGMCGVY